MLDENLKDKIRVTTMIISLLFISLTLLEMKNLYILFGMLFLLTACTKTGKAEQDLQAQIDSLQVQLDNAYHHGFGDFMGSIQNHHNKLWFAGINENWELATFEMHELEELFSDIKTTYPDREETQPMPMIEPGIEAVKSAIQQRSMEEFKEGYTTLTNGCNKCHQTTKYDFIKITTPTIPSFSNQDFMQNVSKKKE